MFMTFRAALCYCGCTFTLLEIQHISPPNIPSGKCCETQDNWNQGLLLVIQVGFQTACPPPLLFISLLHPVVLHHGVVSLLWLDDWDLPKQWEKSSETEMARTENHLGRPPTFTNKNAPALWIRFYLLASPHMQSKHDALGARRRVSASAALGGWVQPGVGEDRCSHG